jgi:hypothetical protein
MEFKIKPDEFANCRPSNHVSSRTAGCSMLMCMWTMRSWLSRSPTQLIRLRRILLQINDLIFRPNDPQDVGRREPISLKKVQQGDTSLSTCHTVLGLLVKQTMELPPHPKERLQRILNFDAGTQTMHCTEHAQIAWGATKHV